MRTILIVLILVAIGLQPMNGQTEPIEAVDYVNSYMGTARKGAPGLIPTVSKPFAMTNFTAQTRENKISRMPYEYEDESMMGFIATHQPNLWMGDYGYVSLLPQVGELKVQPKERAIPFSHDEETVSPYYYSVKTGLSEQTKIKTELAGGDKAAIFKFTFPESKDSRFIIQTININQDPDPDWNPQLNYQKYRSENLEAYVEINPEKSEITGYNEDRFSVKIGPDLPNFKGYFVIQFDKKFSDFGCWNTEGILENVTSQKGNVRLGAYINFKTTAGEVVKARIGTSFISVDQARKNLREEISAWDFDKLVKETKAIWQENLSRFTIEGGTEEQRTIFYTALYHTMLQPRSMTEDNKYYSGFDDKVHKGVSYTDYSLWDTFRALHPLLIISQPDKVGGMVQAMLQMYEQGGRLPMWPNPAETNVMIGTHADAVIADAYIKEVQDFDKELAYEAMWKNSFVPPEKDTERIYGDRDPWTSYEAQAGLTYYKSLGYIPSDKTAESVSRTIEYGVDNYALAQVAREMGKTTDFDQLMKMSKNYKNLYNSETGFMAPKLADGKWDTDTNEKWDIGAHGAFTEGGPWTYLFGAMHDVPGLVELLGGKEKFDERLDKNFEEDHYKHSNEPGHHFIYLYNYIGKPWKTQKLAHEQLRLNYKNEPAGMNGNDDNGQMSAWAVFNMLGIYPVTPASGIYAVGSPVFPKVTIQTKYKGKPHKVEIIAKNVSEKNFYIQKLMVDDKIINEPFITHEQLMTADKIIFEMADRPNFNFN